MHSFTIVYLDEFGQTQSVTIQSQERVAALYAAWAAWDALDAVYTMKTARATLDKMPTFAR